MPVVTEQCQRRQPAGGLGRPLNTVWSQARRTDGRVTATQPWAPWQQHPSLKQATFADHKMRT